jgi:hypothetical protein
VYVQQNVLPVKKATKSDQTVANQLLMKALAQKNIAFSFVESEYFQAYVSYITAGLYKAPSRHHLVAALEDICDVLTTKIRQVLTASPYMSICADSWTKAGRHVTAITAGSPGQSIYMNSYENLGSDTAEVSAMAIHECIMVSLGLKPDMSSSELSFPVGKVAVMTSDTTAVMPATAKRLGEMDLCKGLVWAPCFSHVANLLLLDQLKVHAIADLLAHAKQIVTTFRVGNFRKLFIMCATRSCTTSRQGVQYDY